MGWRDQARAAARRTSRATRKRTTAAVEATRNIEQVDATTQRLGEHLDAARTRSRSLIETVGTTRPGSAVGHVTRKAGSVIREVPGLSAALDLSLHKNGVHELRERLLDNPDDPIVHVQLATALQRVERDLRWLAAGRALINPGSLVVRQALQTAAGLDADVQEPATLRLLKRSFALCQQRLAADPRDGDALHALARIYLMQDQPRHAVRFARQAVFANEDGRGPALITLARAYLALGHDLPARRAAQAATDHGMGLGYEILASVDDPTLEAAGLRERVAVDAERSSQVTPEDRRAYNGVAYSPGEIARAVASVQYSKARQTSTAVTRATQQAGSATQRWGISTLERMRRPNEASAEP